VQLWNRKVNTFWKPVLWFVNGTDGHAGDWIGTVRPRDPPRMGGAEIGTFQAMEAVS